MVRLDAMNRQIVAMSGETVIVDGGIQISGAVMVSGRVEISGQAVWISGGQIGAIVSGTVNQASGAWVNALVSGTVTTTMASGTYFASGVGVTLPGIQISGTVMVSGGVIVSGTVNVASGAWTIDSTSGKVWVTSGSIGAQVSGTVCVSGGVIVSGTVVGKISGENVVVTSAMVSLVSGGWVNALISGTVATTYAAPTLIRIGSMTMVANSTTRIANSSTIRSVTVRSIPRNVYDMFVGDSTILSGQGMILAPGDSIDVETDNIGKVCAYAVLSGELISYLGVG